MDNPINIHTLCLSQVHDLALNQLTAAERKTLEPHLAECISCQTALEDAQGFFADLRGGSLVQQASKANLKAATPLAEAQALDGDSRLGLIKVKSRNFPWLSLMKITAWFWCVWWIVSQIQQESYQKGFNAALETMKEKNK